MTDTDIFSSETTKYRDYLLNSANKLTRNLDDAEDLVQETYIRAFRFFHTYEIGSNCRSWLFKIMRNLFLNYLRKKRTEESRTARLSDHDYMLCYNPNFLEDTLDDRSISAINTVKDDYRLLIILFHLENYSLNEISEYLDWPLGTVKNKLHKARAEMRNMLN